MEIIQLRVSSLNRIHQRRRCFDRCLADYHKRMDYAFGSSKIIITLLFGLVTRAKALKNV